MKVYLDARPVERSKLTVIHRQFGFMSTWTSLNHPFGRRPFGRRPFGRPCTVNLDASKYTNMYLSRPIGRLDTIQKLTGRQVFWAA